MDDPLKSKNNYSEVLAHIKERTKALDAREADIATRHERVLKLEKIVQEDIETPSLEIAKLEKEITGLKSYVAKGQLKIEQENARFELIKAEHEATIKELQSQIQSLETGYNLHYGRNAELAKTLEAKVAEIAAKNKELNELITYHKEQEAAVKEVLEGYNEQLHASKASLEDTNKQLAIVEDLLITRKDDLATLSKSASEQRTKLEGDIKLLEEQRDRYQKSVDEAIYELQQAQNDLAKVIAEHDKTVAETGDFLKRAAVEKKALEESRLLLKKVEGDASDERRRLQSDRAIYGRL